MLCTAEKRCPEDTTSPCGAVPDAQALPTGWQRQEHGGPWAGCSQQPLSSSARPGARESPLGSLKPTVLMPLEVMEARGEVRPKPGAGSSDGSLHGWVPVGARAAYQTVALCPWLHSSYSHSGHTELHRGGLFSAEPPGLLLLKGKTQQRASKAILQPRQRCQGKPDASSATTSTPGLCSGAQKGT